MPPLVEAAMVFGLTVGNVSMGALVQALIPEDYRGRVWGIMGSYVHPAQRPHRRLARGHPGSGAALCRWRGLHYRRRSSGRVQPPRADGPHIAAVSNRSVSPCPQKRCQGARSRTRPAPVHGRYLRRYRLVTGLRSAPRRRASAPGSQRPRISDQAHVRVAAHAAVRWGRCTCPGRPLCPGILSTSGVCAASSATSASH
jgi:hypothetical protein